MNRALQPGIRAAAAALFLFAAQMSPAAAQSDAAVARPEVKAGDRWVYRRTDHEHNRVGRAQYTVVFANDKVIQMVVDRPRKGNDVDETYTAEWNAIATVDGSNMSPHMGGLKFPLVVGASWPVAYENTVPRKGGFRVKHERKAKVIGWEEVRVPAGRFRALKIEIDGSFQRLDRAMAGSAHTVIWYAPRVKRWVKWTYSDKGFKGPISSWSQELVEYEVH